jgi:hypothetical protein
MDLSIMQATLQVIPYVRQFLSTVAKLPRKPKAEKMKAWLEKIEGMSPYALMEEEDRVQMRLDLEALIQDISNG